MKQSVLCVLAVLALASPAFAQKAPPSAAKANTSGFWIDINFLAIGSAQEEQNYTLTKTLFSEPATGTTTYPALPVAYGLGLDGGYQFGHGLGVGVHYMTAKYDSFVGMAIHIPSPIFFNLYGTDSDTTAETLERTDNAFDISATYTFSTPAAWRVRIFGGPTYFSVSQAMVSNIHYDQTASGTTNIVNITTHETETVTGSTWGYHVGADVAFFFSKHFGVGGVVRWSDGSIDINEEPLTGNAITLKAGGITTGGGLRIRF